MHPASFNPAVVIVAEARWLRNSQPALSAEKVLDYVMRGRYGCWIDFGELATPPNPFSLLLAEALDGGMLASDWAGLWRHNSHPKIRATLLQIWADEVWPKFVVRYSLYRPLPGRNNDIEAGSRY